MNIFASQNPTPRPRRERRKQCVCIPGPSKTLSEWTWKHAGKRGSGKANQSKR